MRKYIGRVESRRMCGDDDSDSTLQNGKGVSTRQGKGGGREIGRRERIQMQYY